MTILIPLKRFSPTETGDFCQIQYNYIDTEIQAGDRGYELTEELGIPLVIMEPVKGGALKSLSSTGNFCPVYRL